MYLSSMIKQKKILILPALLVLLIFGVVAFPQQFSFAATTKTQPLKVVGRAKFVLKGTVTTVSANTLTLHVTNTSKNAKLFDNKDKVLTIISKTTLTKNARNIALNQIKTGSKIKAFGIFDKKTGSITIVRWIKVLSK